MRQLLVMMLLGTIAQPAAASQPEQPRLELGAAGGVFGIQYRQTIRQASPDRSAIFLTGGIAGVFEYERMPERREQRSDGSVVVYRGYARTEMNSPAAFSVGVGMQRVFARYVALRAETQMIAGARIGYGVIRGALGISVPIGGHYAAP